MLLQTGRVDVNAVDEMARRRFIERSGWLRRDSRGLLAHDPATFWPESGYSSLIPTSERKMEIASDGRRRERPLRTVVCCRPDGWMNAVDEWLVAIYQPQRVRRDSRAARARSGNIREDRPELASVSESTAEYALR